MSGLRERKARQVRTAIFDAMLALSEEQGYEATTVEQVAARAEVGTATVYRYFPTKDAILLAPVADSVGALAEAFAARPDTEDVRDSLAYAIETVLTRTAESRAETLRLRAQLDVSPGPRARLWDLWRQQRDLLETAIADRMGGGADSVWVSAAAHLTTTVLQLALDHDRSAPSETGAVAYAQQVLDRLHGPDAPVPARLSRRRR